VAFLYAGDQNCCTLTISIGQQLSRTIQFITRSVAFGRTNILCSSWIDQGLCAFVDIICVCVRCPQRLSTSVSTISVSLSLSLNIPVDLVDDLVGVGAAQNSCSSSSRGIEEPSIEKRATSGACQMVPIDCRGGNLVHINAFILTLGTSSTHDRCSV